MDRARRARAIIRYDGMDITEAVSRGLLSLTYTDNTDKADDIQLKLEDVDGNWAGPWYPKVAAQKTEEFSSDGGYTAADNSGDDYDLDYDWDQDIFSAQPFAAAAASVENDFSDIMADPSATPVKTATNSAATPHAVTGTVLAVTIVAEAWDSPGSLDTLYCGAFEVDGFKLDGPPDVASISGVSTPLTAPIRREEHSQGWEDTTLQQVAQDICDKAGLSLLYELDSDPALDRVDQWHEPDLPFLQRLCTDHGAMLKITDNRMVIFHEAGYEARDPVLTIQRGDGRLLTYSFTQDSQDTAGSATVSYKDPKSGKLVTETFAPPQAPAVGQELHLNQRPYNLAGDYFRESAKGETTAPIQDFNDIRVDAKSTAESKARAMLREANRGEFTCKLKIVGHVGMVAGVTFLVSGFGVFDGKYIAESVAHSMGSGYTCDITGHRVLEGY